MDGWLIKMGMHQELKLIGKVVVSILNLTLSGEKFKLTLLSVLLPNVWNNVLMKEMIAFQLHISHALLLPTGKTFGLVTLTIAICIREGVTKTDNSEMEIISVSLDGLNIDKYT